MKNGRTSCGMLHKFNVNCPKVSSSVRTYLEERFFLQQFQEVTESTYTVEIKCANKYSAARVSPNKHCVKTIKRSL